VAQDGSAYLRIDPLLERFAQQHRLELDRNYRDADRSLKFDDALSRTIWIHSTDTYGERGTYRIVVMAHQDRPKRHLKSEVVAESVAAAELESALDRAAQIVAAWTATDLESE
jgi:hypothetical protein